MKKLVLVIGLVLVTACLSSCSRRGDPHAAMAADQPFLYQNDAFIVQVEAGLNRIATNAGISRPIAVNKPYDESVTNLYILDLADVSEKKVARLRPGLRRVIGSLRDNAIALPPDIVVMDIALVGRILENAFADLLMLQQKPGEATGDNLIEILSDHHRIRTMRLNKKLIDDRDDEWFKTGYGGVRVFWPLIVDKLTDAKLVELFATSLAPVLLHEIGHLDAGTAGHLFPDLEDVRRAAKDLSRDVSRYLLGNRIKEIEDAADRFSLAKVQAYLARMMDSPPSRGVPVPEWVASHPMPEDLPFHEQLLMQGTLFMLMRAQESDIALFERQLVASSGKYFRDEVLTEAFHQFRGISAEDNLVRFFHRDCNLETADDPLEYNDYDDLVRGERGFYPILTQSDWNRLRDRFFQHVSAGTHAHNFYRAAAIFSASRDGSVSSNPQAIELDRGAQLFNALMSDSPSIIEPDFDGSTRLKTTRLLRHLEEQMQFEDAISCKELKCRVGRFKNDPEIPITSNAFIEIASDAKDNVVFARFAFPLFVIPREQWNTENHDKGLLRQALEFMVSVRFVQNAFGVELKAPTEREASDGSWSERVVRTPSDPAERFLRFRARVLKCNAASERIEVPGEFTIEYRTLTSDRWIGIEISPPPKP